MLRVVVVKLYTFVIAHVILGEKSDFVFFLLVLSTFAVAVVTFAEIIVAWIGYRSFKPMQKRLWRIYRDFKKKLFCGISHPAVSIPVVREMGLSQTILICSLNSDLKSWKVSGKYNENKTNRIFCITYGNNIFTYFPEHQPRIKFVAKRFCFD